VAGLTAQPALANEPQRWEGDPASEVVETSSGAATDRHEPVEEGVRDLIVVFEDSVSDDAKFDAVQGLIDLPEDYAPIANNMAAITVSDDASTDEINDLVNKSAIKYIEEDSVITLDQTFAVDPLVDTSQNWSMRGPEQTPLWSGNRFGTDAYTAWKNGHTGSKDVYVAVIDTGIEIAHPDLAGNIWVNTREIPDNGVDDDRNGYVDDYNGWNAAGQNGTVVPDGIADSHGTKVAGIIGAVGGNGVGIAGVNWNVGVIPVKGFTNNSGQTSSMIRAVNYVRDLKVKNKINIVAINASWGGGAHNWALSDAIRSAGDEGILFVASAGNDGTNNKLVDHYPSNYDCAWFYRNWNCVISVAAHADMGNLAFFSNYGPNVHLSAPGLNTYTTGRFGEYGSFSGTSAAAPHVSGAVALCASTNPTMTAENIRTAVLNTVTPNPALTYTTSSGGHLNINALTLACSNWGQDYGSITSISQSGPDKMTVDGWIIPTVSTPNDELIVTVDSNVVKTARIGDFTTSQTRTLFSIEIQASAGKRNVCVGTASRQNFACKYFMLIGGDKPVGGISMVPRVGIWSFEGWAVDPTNTKTAKVSLFVDGVFRESVSAEHPARSFPLNEYAGWDPNRDFRFWWHSPGAGNHRACVVAHSVDNTKTSELGCITYYQFAGTNPVGEFDSLRKNSNSQVQISGWALDPDYDSPAEVHVYVDGVYTTKTKTTVARRDIATRYPGYRSTFGFDIPVTVNPNKASQSVCVYAINVMSGNTNPNLGCKTVSNTTFASFGSLDSAQTNGPGRILIGGWAHDPDTTNPIAVHVYVNNKFHSAHTANLARSDVQRAFTTAGPNHGFGATLNVFGGRNNVCVYAIDAVGGNGNPLIGCRVVDAPTGNPFGNVETIRQFGPRGAQLSGWVIDPDTAGAVTLHTYVNGAFRGTGTADLSRTDVGRAFPGFGNNHGFNHTVSGLVPGRNNVCVYAINIGGGTTNPLLGCRTVTVN
jgi:subtilisin family serine protease